MMIKINGGNINGNNLSDKIYSFDNKLGNSANFAPRRRERVVQSSGGRGGLGI